MRLPEILVRCLIFSRLRNSEFYAFENLFTDLTATTSDRERKGLMSEESCPNTLQCLLRNVLALWYL